MHTGNSIVVTPKINYRAVARKNWGLTTEQMKGMHVHHRIPISEGGTNDPSNLFVCSPWFHANVWHGDESFHPFVKYAAKGGSVKGNWEGDYPKMARRCESTCPECGKTFVNKGSMVSHLVRVHKNQN